MAEAARRRAAACGLGGDASRAVGHGGGDGGDGDGKDGDGDGVVGSSALRGGGVSRRRGWWFRGGEAWEKRTRIC